MTKRIRIVLKTYSYIIGKGYLKTNCFSPLQYYYYTRPAQVRFPVHTCVVDISYTPNANI